MGFKDKKKEKLILMAILFMFLLTVLLGVKLGSVKISLLDAFNILKGKLLKGDLSYYKKNVVTIIWNIRLPRILLAFAVGGGLAISGVAMQALTQNVLAEPYILGVSSGASVMVALSYLIFTGYSSLNIAVPIFAFLGALASMIIVYVIGTSGGKGSTNQLLLTGMSLSLILNALTNLIMSLLPQRSKMMNVMMWSWGSLSQAKWDNILLPISISLACLVFFTVFSKNYNIISMGSETAMNLGLDVKRMYFATLMVCAGLIGVLIASSGLIGFVGFIIPHAIRLLDGTNHRRLFPLSFISGGIFLAWMDIFSRTLLAPKELSVGIFSAVFGGPFFVLLLYRKKKYGSIK